MIGQSCLLTRMAKKNVFFLNGQFYVCMCLVVQLGKGACLGKCRLREQCKGREEWNSKHRMFQNTGAPSQG